MRAGLAIGLVFAASVAGPAMAKDFSVIVVECAVAAGAKTVSYVAPVGSDKSVSEQVAGIKFHHKMKLTKAQEKQIRSCVIAKAG